MLIWYADAEDYRDVPDDSRFGYDFGYGSGPTADAPVIGEESPVPGYVVLDDGTVKSYAELDEAAGGTPRTN